MNEKTYAFMVSWRGGDQPANLSLQQTSKNIQKKKEEIKPTSVCV